MKRIYYLGITRGVLLLIHLDSVSYSYGNFGFSLMVPFRPRANPENRDFTFVFVRRSILLRSWMKF